MIDGLLSPPPTSSAVSSIWWRLLPVAFILAKILLKTLGRWFVGEKNDRGETIAWFPVDIGLFLIAASVALRDHLGAAIPIDSAVLFSLVIVGSTVFAIFLYIAFLKLRRSNTHWVFTSLTVILANGLLAFPFTRFYLVVSQAIP